MIFAVAYVAHVSEFSDSSSGDSTLSVALVTLRVFCGFLQAASSLRPSLAVPPGFLDGFGLNSRKIVYQ